MGASDFYQFGKGNTIKDAFLAAREEAAYDCGHSGYTGTLAEKNDFVLIKTPKVQTDKEATELAHKLIEANDKRIDDKWGPAGAIPVKKDRWLFFGWASS